jgi:hypothetical protein
MAGNSSFWKAVALTLEQSWGGDKNSYAAFFFPALTFAYRFGCSAAIFLRADADMVPFAGAEPITLFAGCEHRQQRSVIQAAR